MKALLLAMTLAAGPAGVSDLMESKRSEAGVSLTWADAEERVTATLSPAVLTVGEKVRVTARVEALSGKAFEGPLRLSVRHSDDYAIQSHVVPFKEADRIATADFLVDRPGNYQLEIGFTSTRAKSTRAPFEVRKEAVPKWLKVGAMVVPALLLVGYGVHRARRGGFTP